MPAKQMNNKPIHEVRLGLIKAAVWKNESDTSVRYNVTFSRLYKDGDQWKSTESFGRDDLLLLAKVVDQTHSWILAMNHEHNGGSQPIGSKPAVMKNDLFAGHSAPTKGPVS